MEYSLKPFFIQLTKITLYINKVFFLQPLFIKNTPSYATSLATQL